MMIQFDHVLIVDDSSMMRAVLRKSLTMAKIQVSQLQEAKNGREALDRLRSQDFDVMFCDLNMPELNGDELISMLPSIAEIRIPPIVIVSSEASDERIQRIDSPHVVGVLRKPFTPEALSGLMNQVRAVPAVRG